MARPQQQSVSQVKLRKIYNQNDFQGKVQRGLLTARIVKEHHPSPPLAFVPYCTRSQLVSYHEPGGKKVAIVHQYLQPDGTLGASGKPDPKFLLHNGIRYHLKIGV